MVVCKSYSYTENMKIILSLFATLSLLTACGSSEGTSQNANIKGKVPASCELPEVVAKFAAQVPESKFVPTDWQAFPDTDLAAVLDNNGIACAYGIQVAEVGGTVLWTANATNIWEQRKASWIEFGETPIDLPGIDETAAYVLKEGTESGEMHVWKVNLLINDVWIQVGASFFQDVKEALPIIKAAIVATQ
jgi:hypothetical protein